MADKTMIEATAKALLASAPPGSQVILFGSHAKGTARQDSDLDFLVIEPAVEDRFSEMVRLRRAIEPVLHGTIQAVDVLVMNDDRFRRTKDVPNTLAFEAAQAGRLYA